MGKQENQWLSHWEDFATQLRSITITHTMCKLSQADQQIARDALCLWNMIVWDSLLLHTSGNVLPKTAEDVNRHKVYLHAFLTCIETKPIDTVIDTLKVLDEQLLLLVERNGPCFDLGLNSWFRQFPSGFGWLRNTLYRGVAMDAMDPVESFAFLHQVCTFLSRLTLNVASMEDDALKAWIDRQDAIARRPVVDYTGLKAIVESWFTHPYRFDGKFQNGKGSSFYSDGSSSRDVYDKLSQSEWTPRMRYVDEHYFGGSLLHPYGYKCDKDTPSQLTFVPKSYKKLRSIAMENPAKMWVQQFGMSSTDKWFLDHPVLSRKIKLHESGLNTTLARLGSIGGQFATIDLSNASDDVSWLLVKNVFRNTPVYPLLLAGRTQSVLTRGGTEVTLHSHCPMGSALCFPVETVVFAAIVAEAIQSLGGVPDRQVFAVYGDDIIVGAHYATTVVERLQYYGFSVNTEKTFLGNGFYTFRESCGGEYLNGVDVTPLRISRKFTGLPSNGKCTPNQYVASIELANELFLRYPTARRIVVARLLALPAVLRPFFSEDTSGLKSLAPTNGHLFRDRKRSADYQRAVFIHGKVSAPRGTSYHWQEQYRLYNWLLLFGQRSLAVMPPSLTARVSTVTSNKSLRLSRSTESINFDPSSGL